MPGPAELQPGSTGGSDQGIRRRPVDGRKWKDPSLLVDVRRARIATGAQHGYVIADRLSIHGIKPGDLDIGSRSERLLRGGKALTDHGAREKTDCQLLALENAWDPLHPFGLGRIGRNEH